ncbi:AraC family transcriptional regulator [Paenibacillus agricola]|uniref:AraC family transcriptional regulator n=1 Tax=Paenibacillus agricola TaxID=2716264 RepID=UPI002892CFD0|nr:AraC family transcriptional regulator [Paenibacillus agricola]
MENFLTPIDQIIAKEILVNDLFRRFFNDQNNETYTNYEISQKLNNLIINFPIIYSVYIFHQADQLIISNSTLTYLSNFSDRDFILSQMEKQQPVSWTGKRIYKDQKRFEPMPVVTLVRKVPFLTGEQGIIVVNIRVSDIQSLVVKMSSLKTSFVNFFDGKGELIFSTNDMDQLDNHRSKELARIKSGYTNWEVRSGIKDGNIFNFFSFFPYFWVTLGFISIVMGFLLVIYVTRLNYRPIESIINRINGVFVNKNSDLFGKVNQDEMRFIELAIDNLLEQTTKFQNQYKEDLIHIRRNFFIELLEGNRFISLGEWKSEMKRLGRCDDFERIMFGILEIDKYIEFSVKYSDRDQYLLKFVLNSVVNEIAEGQEINVWTEWISNSQLGIIFQLKNQSKYENEHQTNLVLQVCNKAISWVNANLNFTITVGNGGSADKITEIPQLYEDALDSLKYKSVLGNQRVINYWELSNKPRQDIFNLVQLIHSIAQTYRLGDETWKKQFDQFFYEAKIGLFPREDITSLLYYLIYYLDRGMIKLSVPIQDSWKQNVMPALTKMLEEFETLEEFQTNSYQVLKQVEDQISLLRESRTSHPLIHEVKKYIGDKYANPDLSLIHLSEEFNLSSRYLSRLFKDEFGEKFVDYLVRVRIEHAKKFLQETPESVQGIALKVGYVHPFSFIRVFKRMVGVTPGDFRK